MKLMTCCHFLFSSSGGGPGGAGSGPPGSALFRVLGSWRGPAVRVAGHRVAQTSPVPWHKPNAFSCPSLLTGAHISQWVSFTCPYLVFPVIWNPFKGGWLREMSSCERKFAFVANEAFLSIPRTFLEHLFVLDPPR